MATMMINLIGGPVPSVEVGDMSTLIGSKSFQCRAWVPIADCESMMHHYDKS